MQFNILSAFILASVAFGSVQAAAVDRRAPLDAGSTCTDWSIVPNTADVTALCQDRAKLEQPTSISLGACVHNNNGALSCAPGGNADGTCVFFNLHQSGSNVLISATCKQGLPGSPDEETDDFNLNDCFTNTDGVLGC
ncbi:hypothetical protein C8F01DRAFT_1146959 [Mycena amicta]|nr:hypothetical protein C8F01DRAFT_1146959 [Mycena amicta]